MTKFGGVISKARAAKQEKGTDNNDDKNPENQKKVKPENQITEAKLFSTTSAPTFPEGEKSIDDNSLESQTMDLFVNLSIRVPKSMRQHWAAEAKRSGTTLTKAITEALNTRFGRP